MIVAKHAEGMHMDTKDYIRIESALAYLSHHAEAQPALADVAKHVGLSEHHLQRLFTRWAGISPKRFLQFQTVESAKSLLRDSRSVLDTTYSTGLSSGGRLHDLFITLEAVTPGEYKSGGTGLTIATGFHESPFGECLVAVTGRGVCGLSFVIDGDRNSALAELASRWPGATLVEDQRATQASAQQIFAAWGGAAWKPDASTPSESVTPTPLSVLVRGTNFQVRVWEALLRIPPGAVATYEDVSAAIGQSGATRAVGSAIARNPVAYLIPCHRVIRKAGAFGEYHWGAARKVAMLMRESAARPAGDSNAAAPEIGGVRVARPAQRDLAIALG
jgi:AraC family transcriptional regulator, regulatory protein of adaptative response / methylated-DNA-[protein]-cysteine methyltransferase